MHDDQIQPKAIGVTAEAEADETKPVAADRIPSLIVAAGEKALEQYQAFLNTSRWSPTTRKSYREQIARFCRWAEARGRTLTTITASDGTDYAAEIADRSTQHTAMVALTSVRGLFRRLASSGVLPADPCPKGQPKRRSIERSPDAPEPSIPLSKLKSLVLEIGEPDGWIEECEDFQAGLVMIAPLSIKTRDPKAISRFTGVPARLVREYADRLTANRIWRSDGKIGANWHDPNDGGLAFMLDVWTTLGLLEREPAPDKIVNDEAAPPQSSCRLLPGPNSPTES